MESDSLWLGAMRGPVKTLLKILCAVVAVTFLILVIQRLFFDGQVGVHEILRPEGGFLGKTMMYSLFGAIFVAGV